MARILISKPNSDSDRYAFSAGSQAATMEVNNLKDQQPGEPWRIVDLNNAYMEIFQAELRGQLDPWNLIWFGYTSLSSEATWRVRCANTRADLTASPLYDSTVRVFWPSTDLHDWPWVSGFLYTGTQYQTYPWTRVDFFDPAPPNGWMDLGRLFMTSAYQPSKDVRAGWSLRYIHNVQYEETQGGQIYPMPGPGKRRGLKFSLQFLSEDEMLDNAFHLDRLRGGSGDVLVIRDHESRHVHKHMIYGVIKDLGEIVNLRGGIFDKNYGVEELPQ